MCIVAALTALGANCGLHQVIAAEPGPTDAEEGVQVLTRGPVHEAFAETVTFNPEPGIEVAKAPPDAIEEVPPELKPEGDNVAWIPGYWGWDDERSDFLWVSGIWRALPPGRQWVAGYWSQSREGYQWTSGFWADAQVSEVEYLSEPPQTVEAGPNVDAPSADQTWIPGCWVWHQSRYAWRPGYWAAVQPDWVWVPAHYVWAPRGYVFVDGYWDYSVGSRGVLFAPVYFNASVYAQPGFSYSPAMVINLAMFTNHLFLRPSYCHYYFGDYYAASYSNAGFYPSFSFQSSRYGYDPIYAHQHWQHRQDVAWERNVQADFQHRRDHEDARPPRTLAAQKDLSAADLKSNNKTLVVATPLNQLVKSKDSPMRFQPVDKQDRQRLAQHGPEIQKFREQRQQLETTPAGSPAKKTFREAGPAKVKLPRSLIVAKSADELGKDQAPPKRHEVLKPNLQIEPKPRSIGSGAFRDDGPNGRKIEPVPARKADGQPTLRNEPKPALRIEPKQGAPAGRREPPHAEPRVNTAEPTPAPPKVGPQVESKEKPKK
jgi:hypothetical protein